MGLAAAHLDACRAQPAVRLAVAAIPGSFIPQQNTDSRAGLPVIVVLDAEGTVSQIKIGPFEDQDELGQAIEEATN